MTIRNLTQKNLHIQLLIGDYGVLHQNVLRLLLENVFIR